MRYWGLIVYSLGALISLNASGHETIHVIVAAGQSNNTRVGAMAMLEHPEAGDLENLEVWFYMKGASRLATQWLPTDDKNPSSLYHQMLNHPDEKIGVGIHMEQGVLIRKARLEKEGKRVRFLAFTWMQGEADSNTERYARQYADNLERLIGMIRADLGSPDLPVIVGRIHADIREDGVPGKYRYKDRVRLAQELVAQKHNTVCMVDVDDLDLHPEDNLHVHLNRPSLRELGTRMMDCVLKLSEIVSKK